MPHSRGFVQGLEMILSGHESGLYKLPGEIVKLLEQFDRLEAESRQAFEPSNGYGDLATAIEAAAISGDPMPSLDDFVQCQLRVKAHEERQTVFRDQTERKANQLRAAIHHGADQIIVSCMRPAHARAVSSITTNIGVLKGQLDPAMLLGASAAQRTARQELSESVATYTAIRSAYTQLLRFTHGPAFTVGLTTEFNNSATFRPHGQLMGNKEETPDSPVERLAFYLSLGLKPWLPTPGELEVSRAGGDKATTTAATTTATGNGQAMPRPLRSLNGGRADQRVRGGRVVDSGIVP
jgi:hypothetical protein